MNNVFALGMDGDTPTLDPEPVTFTVPQQGTIAGDRAPTVHFILNDRFLAMDGDTPYLLPPVTNGLVLHLDGDTPYLDPADLTPWPRSIGPDIGDPLYDVL